MTNNRHFDYAQRPVTERSRSAGYSSFFIRKIHQLFNAPLRIQLRTLAISQAAIFPPCGIAA